MLKLTNIEIFMTSGGSICECYCSYFEDNYNSIASDDSEQLELAFKVKATYKGRFIGFFKNDKICKKFCFHDGYTKYKCLTPPAGVSESLLLGRALSCMPEFLIGIE